MAALSAPPTAPMGHVSIQIHKHTTMVIDDFPRQPWVVLEETALAEMPMEPTEMMLGLATQGLRTVAALQSTGLPHPAETQPTAAPVEPAVAETLAAEMHQAATSLDMRVLQDLTSKPAAQAANDE